MIRRYRFGTMIPTDSVVQSIEISGENPPFWQGGPTRLTYRMQPEDVVYGLGENLRGINKRGWHYVSSCADQPIQTEEVLSLYGAHNFLLIDGRAQRFGVFFDYAGRIEYDVGYTDIDELCVLPADENYEMYVITGDSCRDIVRQLRRLTGRSYIPPKWAFGYGQSRWGYRNADDVRQVVRSYRENGIPLDSVYLDIDYMQDYIDFTVNKSRFPDLAALAAEMKEQHVRLVPIIDAGVKIEPGNETYEQGRENGYFCKDEQGNDFVGAVWPGLVHFPDFLNRDARRWFGRRYQVLLDQGIEGFWNDMNEPAIFYTPERLMQAVHSVAALDDPDIAMDKYFSVKNQLGTLINAPEDYAKIRHRMDGETVEHEKVHNLFGYNMTRAAGEAFEEKYPDKRILLFSRASCIGMHRYGGIWYGDNRSWWDHLRLNLKMLASVNMCGFLYSGADIGGFGADTTEDLLLRWLALGIFSPLMRNHSSMGTRPQEAYRFTRKQDFANLIGIRYGLVPYLYSEFMKAVLTDDMLFRPLAFDYPGDEHAPQVESQLMFGEGVMIAPVMEQNADGRYVYLPERMKLIRMRSTSDYEEQVLEAGHHYVRAALNEVIFFIRPGCVVPLADAAQCVEEIDTEHLRLLHFAESGTAEYRMYDDDGYTRDYEDPANIRVLRVTV